MQSTVASYIGVAKGVGNRINNLQGQVNRLGKRMNAGVAGAMAAANLMQPHKPGQSAAMAAVGQHRGEAALAVGYSRISDNGKYGIKIIHGCRYTRTSKHRCWRILFLVIRFYTMFDLKPPYMRRLIFILIWHYNRFMRQTV